MCSADSGLHIILQPKELILHVEPMVDGGVEGVEALRGLADVSFTDGDISAISERDLW